MVTAPAHGSLTGTAPNVTYTPNANYNGPDSFTFKVNDGALDSVTTATVSITVSAVNDIPVCSGTFTSNGDEDTQLSGTASGACSDVADGTAVTYHLGTQASHGTAVVNANGTWTYNPVANYNGADSFTFMASDGTATPPAPSPSP